MTPEGAKKKEIKDYLDSLGPDCRYFMTQNMGMGESGVADIIGVYFGIAFAIEVKRDEKQKASPWQARFLMEWSRAGGRTLLTSRVNDVMALMTSIRMHAE